MHIPNNERPKGRPRIGEVRLKLGILNFKTDPANIQVLKEFVERQKFKHGEAASYESVLMSAFYQQHPEELEKAKELRKEMLRHEAKKKKSLDGIIRSTRISKEVRGL